MESYKERMKSLESEVESSRSESDKYKEKIGELQTQLDSSKTIREKMKFLESQIESFRKEKEGDGTTEKQEAQGTGQTREELQKVIL